MAIVDLPTAKLHLRVTHAEEDTRVTAMVAAALEQAQAFLNRNVYETPQALAAAVAATPAALAAASTAYDTALEAAYALAVEVERQEAERSAWDAYRDAVTAARMTNRGMVVNESIRTAILLIAASLWEHRGDEDSIEGVPKAARTFLWPFRVDIGV